MNAARSTAPFGALAHEGSTLDLMEHPTPGLWQRFLQFVGLRKPPPDSGVREPRRPKPSASGGVATLEPPETDDRTS